MTPISVLFLSLGIIFVVLLIGVLIIHTKYIKFVQKHSISLQKLKEINSRYKFKNVTNISDSHIYDNSDFYGEITCRAYLTYFLRDNKDQVNIQLQNAETNKQLHSNYINELKSINSFGTYDCDSSKYIKFVINKYEKRTMDSFIQKPDRQFKIFITLYCATLSGRIYSQKSQAFDANDISGLLNRLANKDGDYYRDRDIWDNLCRVERGKVTNALRFEIYERDHYTCQKCGLNGCGHSTGLEIDHIIPISKGGKSIPSNLQTLCHKCNESKGNSVEHQ